MLHIILRILQNKTAALCTSDINHYTVQPFLYSKIQKLKPFLSFKQTDKQKLSIFSFSVS